MKTFEIFFEDLSENAKERFKKEGLWHENIDLIPLAIVEFDESELEEEDE